MFIKYPPAVYNFFQNDLINSYQPAYILLDQSGAIIDWGGQLDVYGIQQPEKGASITEFVFFLSGLLPLDGEKHELPCIEMKNGKKTKIHLFHDGTGDCVLFLDVAEEMGKWGELKQERHDLELLVEAHRKAERNKNEFISTVSHELRTPLTSIYGALQLVLGGMDVELPEQVKKLLNIALNNTSRLSLIINDILDIEKIESGKMSFNFQKINLSELILESIECNSSYAKIHAVQYKAQNLPEQAWVSADHDRLLQVMNNLLSNAAKYSPPEDPIIVNIEINDKNYKVSVTDQGPGIPPEFQARVFEKFAQDETLKTKQKGGTGLGLSIARAIIQKHGGNLDFISGQGQGTRFYFELPRQN